LYKDASTALIQKYLKKEISVKRQSNNRQLTYCQVSL
jgi:hypothetical protein